MSPKIKSRLQKLTTRILWRDSSFGPHIRLSDNTGEVSSLDGVQPGFFKKAIVEISQMMRDGAVKLVGNWNK